MSLDRKIDSAMALLTEALEATKPVALFGLFSGGHDSVTSTCLASKHPRFTAAAHMNTGIGIEATRDYVREVSAARGWSLREYKAADCGQVYRELAVGYGFPGPAAHRKMYARLKERPLRRLIKDAKAGHPRTACVALATGIRSEESKIRMGYKEHWRREGSYVWVNAIHDWTKSDCMEFMEREKLPRNRVVDLIHMSGECLCGAFAHVGERKEIAFWFPEVGRELDKIEADVKAKGFTEPRCHWGWAALVGKGSRPPVPGPLCHGCDGRSPK